MAVHSGADHGSKGPHGIAAATAVGSVLAAQGLRLTPYAQVESIHSVISHEGYEIWLSPTSSHGWPRRLVILSQERITEKKQKANRDDRQALHEYMHQGNTLADLADRSTASS
eukprot:scaffold223467_cov49-Prasinocladus_malaysianus.AAC.2